MPQFFFYYNSYPAANILDPMSPAAWDPAPYAAAQIFW